ncbi:TetR/AcrR family transcriptional regulator C-terminal domain-containing protein [Nocardiopsis sp. RSe5-2]|uniref:TetR/AcrR family transcriptional regulator C-terminal domain-containing protein n=1 Tax=Nocardiopsis endophytica TaxID=3018445 RepID=A0ABT4TYQ8_9ACTN|nr:TetR/AcrR family transcriptional regulator C-terminal domain-containing protein [Nocardiopsis endophytica]MDA2809836.1 TetR/AcrR family transcriptional regulator C-terminal domain-containing protein [Nocardiopsis endophytica]
MADGAGGASGTGAPGPGPVRAAELLWGARRAPARGPRPGLTLERIARAAVALADAEGLEGLSMQRVAADLGYTKMSLYRYVSGREDLTALMVDAAFGPPPASLEGEGWRDRLRAWALAVAPLFTAHPWLAQAAVGARVMGPNELGWLEAALSALAHTGLSGPERLDAVVLLAGHVRTEALQSAAGGEDPEGAIARAMGPVLEEHGDRFPEARSAMADTQAPGRNMALEFGVECVLDGLAARMERRGDR